MPASVEAYVLTYTQQPCMFPKSILRAPLRNSMRQRKKPSSNHGDTLAGNCRQRRRDCALWWRSPTEDDAVIVQDATLLSFSEIQSIFEKMVLVVFGNSNDGTKITVDGVRMGLTRIVKKKAWKALVGSAWHSTGRLFARSTMAASKRIPMGRLSMLIINAVDGSIIDPYQGVLSGHRNQERVHVC